MERGGIREGNIRVKSKSPFTFHGALDRHDWLLSALTSAMWVPSFSFTASPPLGYVPGHNQLKYNNNNHNKNETRGTIPVTLHSSCLKLLDHPGIGTVWHPCRVPKKIFLYTVNIFFSFFLFTYFYIFICLCVFFLFLFSFYCFISYSEVLS